MKLTTIKNLSNNNYSVRLEAVPTAATTELISDFGAPTVSLGGAFYGYGTVTLSTSLADRTYIVGDTSGATGYVVDATNGALHQIGSTPSFTTEGLNNSASTITALTTAVFTLSASTVRLTSEFPTTNVFTISTSADIFASEARYRINTELTTLRAKSDTFSETWVETL